VITRALCLSSPAQDADELDEPALTGTAKK